MPRDRNARGSVKPHPHKGWAIRPYVPPDPRTGKRRQKSSVFHGTEREAWAELARQQSIIDRGEVVDPSRLTMAQLCHRWLEDEAAHRVRPTTLEDYAATIQTHLVPAIGTKRAQSVTPSDVAALRAHLLRSTGTRTTQLALLRLKQVLSWAVSVELLARNVAAGIKPPADTTKEKRALTHAEARAFLEIAESDTLSPLWRLYLATGLRRGEGIGLRWKDVDLDAHTLSVRQQVVLSGKPARSLIAEPKSAAARRSLEIDAVTTDALIEHKEVQLNHKREARLWKNLDLVFCTGHGTPLNPNNIDRSFVRLREAAGFDRDITLHSLRHTHATHLLLAGVPVGIVSRRLGHAKTSITLDVYGHVLPGSGGGGVGRDFSGVGWRRTA